MKGDFSRLPAPRAPYSGVWMQQGRVQLDQDWNEQRVLDAERARAALRDLVGADGAPAGDPGFRVRARGGLHCAGQTVLEAEVEVVFAGGEATVEVRVVLAEGEEGGVLVEVEEWLVLWVDEDGRPAFRAGAEGTTVAAPGPLPRGTPVLVSASYDGRAAVLHLDGRPVAAAAVRRADPPSSAVRLRVGGAAGGDGAVERAFGGRLDEVRLWSHARTPPQVRETAARTLTGAEAGLAAYLPLDEGEGPAARDAVSGRHARARGEARWVPHALTLGSGRMYVDGIPCVSGREVPLDRQPDLPGVHPPGPGRHLVYLDVWEGYVSAAEDPGLRDPALGGLDTTGRTRTVWQARSLPLAPDEAWNDALLRLQRAPARSAMAARRTPPDFPAAGNRLYRVEVHGAGGLFGWPRPPADTARAARVTAVERAAAGGGTLTLRPGSPDAAALVPGARVEIFTRATEQARTAGTLAHVTAVDPARHRVTLDALPAGLEAAGEPRLRAVATFLWSDDNAWQAWPVHALDRATGQAVLGGVGPEGLRLSPGDLVELSDHRTALLPRPGLLLAVRDVDPHAETVTLDAPVAWPAVHAEGGTLLRRWSRRGDGPAEALPVRADQWTPLGDGVEVRFEGTAFRTGDYWTIPMRVAAPGGLEWPSAGGRASALPPQGIEHRYAALATVEVHPHRHHPHRHRIEVHDHRRIFAPLAALTREENGERHHHHHHHHHHGDDEEVVVTVRDGDVRVETDVREDEDGESVEVRVDDRTGPDVRVRVHDDHGRGGYDEDARAHHRHRHRHHGEHGRSGDEVSVDVDLHDRHGREEVSVDVDRHGRHGREDVSVDVDLRDRHGREVDRHGRHGREDVSVDVDRHGRHGGEEVSVDVDRHGRHGGEDVSVDGDRHGRHGREEVSVDVDRHDRHGGEEVSVDVDLHDRHGREDVSVDVDRHGRHGREDVSVDVDLDDRHGREDVSVEVDRHGRHRGENVSVDVDVEEDGDVEVDVHTRGDGEDEEVRVVVHAQPAVPAGFWIFGETLSAPEGFARTGARLTLPEARPAWRRRAPLPDPCPGRVRCVVLGESIFAFCDGGNEVLRTEPGADSWDVETRLHHRWSAYAVAVLDGRIHLVGGRDGRGRIVDWHQAWNPATGQWEARAPLGSPRCEMGAAALQGSLYVAGGTRALLSMTTAAVDAYDPGADAWTGVRGMRHARANPGMVAAAGRLFVVGGREPGFGAGSPSGHAESYTPASGRWTDLDEVPTPCMDAALAVLDGVLYLVGGDAGAGPTGLTQACSLRGGGWMVGPEMEVARTGPGLAALSGRLFAVGGSMGAVSTDSVEECRIFFDLHGYRRE